MKTKKMLSMLLALAMVASFFTFTAPVAMAADIVGPNAQNDAATGLTTALEWQGYNAECHNIDYDTDATYTISPVAAIPGKLKSATPGTEGDAVPAAVGDMTIDLEKEILKTGTLPKAITHISVDGGSSWKAFSAASDKEIPISKFLDKGGEFWFITCYDAKAKAPSEYVKGVAKTATDDAIASVEGSAIYKFAAIEERPKPGKYKPEYASLADKTGVGNGAWTMLDMDVADIKKLQIAYSKDGKVADTAGWGKISEAGIFVQPADKTGKPVKTSYLVRVAPSAANPISAGSKAKKVTASSVIKAPTFKIDYKKETIKTKEGTMYVVAKTSTVESTNTLFSWEAPGATGTGFTTWAETAEPMDKEAAKAGIPLVDSTKTNELNYLYGKSLLVRIAATEKKPASACQLITVADVAALYYADVKLTVAKGKVSFDKKYELLDNTDGTGKKIGKDADGGYIRLKNTAKYDAKKNTTTGSPASRFIEVAFTSGPLEPKKENSKEGITGWNVKLPATLALTDLLPGEAVVRNKSATAAITGATGALNTIAANEVIAEFDTLAKKADGDEYTVLVADLEFAVSGFADIVTAGFVEALATKTYKVSVGATAISTKQVDFVGPLTVAPAVSEAGALKDYKVYIANATRTLNVERTKIASITMTAPTAAALTASTQVAAATLNAATPASSATLTSYEWKLSDGTIFKTGGTAPTGNHKVGTSTLTLVFAAADGNKFAPLATGKFITNASATITDVVSADGKTLTVTMTFTVT